MLKLYEPVPRRADVPKAQFHDHWRHPHGTLAIPIPTLRAYVQNHRIETQWLGPEQERFDGVVEAWFATAEDVAALADDPQYAEHVQPDEPNFIDVPNMVMCFTREEVVTTAPAGSDRTVADQTWDGPARAVVVKLLQFVEPDGDPGWASDDDAELGAALGAYRHVRSRATEEIHPDGAPYLGVRELWWPTEQAFDEAMARGRTAWDALQGNAGASWAMLARAERMK